MEKSYEDLLTEGIFARYGDDIPTEPVTIEQLTRLTPRQLEGLSALLEVRRELGERAAALRQMAEAHRQLHKRFKP